MNDDRQKFWSQTFSDHQGGLRRFFRRRVADAWEVDDLVQEVYWRLLHSESRERETIHNLKAYLFTVAANLLSERSLLYQRTAQQVQISELLPELHSANDASPEEQAFRESRRLRLAQAVERLPPRCKAVIVMQYREGMSYSEIAERMGISTHMVKKYVVRSLALCRKALSHYEQ